jgi:hypothetical protein
MPPVDRRWIIAGSAVSKPDHAPRKAEYRIRA